MPVNASARVIGHTAVYVTPSATPASDRCAWLGAREYTPPGSKPDFAALALGAVTVPVYSTQTAEQTSYILNDSGARIIAVSTSHQLEKVLTIQPHTQIGRVQIGRAHV